MRLLPGSCCLGPCRWWEARNHCDQTGRETLALGPCQDLSCWTKTSFTFLTECWPSHSRISGKLAEVSLHGSSPEVFVGFSSIYRKYIHFSDYLRQTATNKTLKEKEVFSNLHILFTLSTRQCFLHLYPREWNLYVFICIYMIYDIYLFQYF